MFIVSLFAARTRFAEWRHRQQRLCRADGARRPLARRYRHPPLRDPRHRRGLSRCPTRRSPRRRPASAQTRRRNGGLTGCSPAPNYETRAAARLPCRPPAGGTAQRRPAVDRRSRRSRTRPQPRCAASTTGSCRRSNPDSIARPPGASARARSRAISASGRARIFARPDRTATAHRAAAVARRTRRAPARATPLRRSVMARDRDRARIDVARQRPCGAAASRRRSRGCRCRCRYRAGGESAAAAPGRRAPAGSRGSRDARRCRTRSPRRSRWRCCRPARLSLPMRAVDEKPADALRRKRAAVFRQPVALGQLALR